MKISLHMFVPEPILSDPFRVALWLSPNVRALNLNQKGLSPNGYGAVPRKRRRLNQQLATNSDADELLEGAGHTNIICGKR